MEFQTTQGALFYEACGDGRPLILLHGNGEDHHIFDCAVADLQKHFQVYAIDTRGHGQSFPVREYHYREMAQDIREFITGLALEKPIICGFSDGGILALMLAYDEPDLLGGIIACGANTRPEGIKPLWLHLFRAMYFFNRSPLFRMMLTQPHITQEQLAAIRCPALITGGSRDMISPKHLEEIAAQIPGARLKILPGETHSSYIVGSKTIAGLILAFAQES